MADVFISYAREDRARAEQVARAIEALGFDVFWDSEVPPGQTWADYIEAKLAQCKAMLVLWSATSTKSQWVREEARMARDRGVLIPVMLDESAPPFGFGEVQGANLAGWRGEPNHPEWTRLANALRSALGAPTRAPRAAPAPQPQSFVGAAPAADAASLTPIGYIRKCFRLYLNANGRARRAEYWWWTLFATGMSALATMVDLAAFAGEAAPAAGLVGLGLLCPGVCVTIRRWHDVGLSGWLLPGAIATLLLGGALAEEIPAAGGLLVILVVVVMLTIALIPSRPGPNAYGPNPKGL